MSGTLQASYIKDGSSSSNNIALDSSGNVAVAGNLNVGGNFASPFNGTFRNRIINGDMKIDQRTSGSGIILTTSLAYNMDRWVGYVTSSTSTVTLQRIATGLTDFPYAARIARGSGTYTGAAVLTQVIESVNCQDLAGQTATMSFYVRKGSAFSCAQFWCQVLLGSGVDQGIAGGVAGSWTNWAGPVSFITSGSSLNAAFTRYSAQVSIPAGTNEIGLYFVCSAFSGTGSSADYIDITGVQLEAGPLATAFERRPYGVELALCQRYYNRFNYSEGFGEFYWEGTALSGVTTYGNLQRKHPVTMRAAPTFSASGATLTAIATSASGSYTTPNYHYTQVTNSNGANTRAAYYIQSGYLDWSAEL